LQYCFQMNIIWGDSYNLMQGKIIYHPYVKFFFFLFGWSINLMKLIFEVNVRNFSRRFIKKERTFLCYWINFGWCTYDV
jgi:hypothetical protein